MLKGSIQIAATPDVALTFEISPVDYISQSIIHLSQQEAALGKVFHLYNPRTVSWHTISEKARDAGYALEVLPYKDWMTKLLAAIQQGYENALAPFLPVLTPERFEPDNAPTFHLDDDNTQRFLP